jgi:hypothetical protein
MKQHAVLMYPVQLSAAVLLIYRSETRANSHKLTVLEEKSLQKWIFSLDDRGAAPRPTTVREVANLLLAARGSTPVQTVGEKWAYNYVQ